MVTETDWHPELKFTILLIFKLTLTEVEVTFMASDLINSSIVKQLKAVKGAVLHLAQTHPSLQLPRPWDACTGAGRQSGLGSFLRSSHSYRFSRSNPGFFCSLLPNYPKTSQSPSKFLLHVYIFQSRDKTDWQRKNLSFIICHKNHKRLF